MPIRAFYARQLAQGEAFDWMPQIFSGFYLTGEGQAGTYHPLHLLLYSLLPLRAAMDWEWLLSYPFMLAGTWLFLRRRIGNSSAAMLGSVFFTFSSFNLLHFIHPNAVAIVAHIPWLLWTIDIVLIDSAANKGLLCAGARSPLLTGSQLIVGISAVCLVLAVNGIGLYDLYFNRSAPCPAPAAISNLPCHKCVGCYVSTWPDLILAKFIGLFLGGANCCPPSTPGSQCAAIRRYGLAFSWVRCIH